MKNKRLCAAIPTLLLLAACTNPAAQPAAPGTQPGLGGSESHPATMADPSLAYCENNGYELVPVVKNGVPHSYLCVNKAKGLKCDSWAFYRKQCSLGNEESRNTVN